MKIYISASWKQRERVRSLAVKLRADGHEVYDFTDAACRKTPEIPPERFPDQFDPERHIYREYISAVPEWREAVVCNREALCWCEVVVLLLPAGNDAHSDWALAVGMGKWSVVVGQPRAGDRTPSHLWANALLDKDDDVIDWLRKLQLTDNVGETRLRRNELHLPKPNRRRQRLLTQDPDANTRCEDCGTVCDSLNTSCPKCGGSHLAPR